MLIRPSAQGFFRQHWPLAGVLGLYWITVLGLAALALRMNQGHLAYVLDDAYIHLAMAKNYALHGVWGMTGEGFTSTTSSPLWTLLLALLFRAFGMHDTYPFWLNLACGTAILIVSYRILGRDVGRGLLKFMILAVLFFITPLSTLALSGMEHSLHLLISLVFLSLAAGSLAAETPPPLSKRIWLWVLAPLLTATRYEGLFLVLMVCILFLFKKRFVDAMFLGITGLLPVLGYGMISRGQGWYFLPNSLLLKGQLPVFSAEGVIRLFGYNAFEQLKNHSVLLILCAVVLICMIYQILRNQGMLDFKIYTSIIYLGCLLLHLQFAQTGWFYRYEAYLVFLGGLVVGLYGEDLLQTLRRLHAIQKTRELIFIGILLAVILAFPLADRASRAFLTTSQAMNNIFEQQVQMGRFIREYYEGEAVAINDIGVVSYMADIHLVDLWGLASLDVARLKLAHAYAPGAIAELAQREGVKVAIVYDLFFYETGGLPASWEKVGEWRILNNRVCASDTVAFYIVDAGEKERLLKNLYDFQDQLPSDVEQSGEYLGTEGG